MVLENFNKFYKNLKTNLIYEAINDKNKLK